MHGWIKGLGQYESLLEEARTQSVRQYGVSAIIMHDGKVLLMRRRLDDFLPGIYEFPGGAVEEGEGLADAVIREVREGTGLTVRGIGSYVGFFDYESEDGMKRRVFNFKVEVGEPLEIQLKEHDHFVWAGEKQLDWLSLTDPILQILRQVWSRTAD